MQHHIRVSLFAVATAWSLVASPGTSQNGFLQEGFLHPVGSGINWGYSLDIDGDRAVIGHSDITDGTGVTMYTYDPLTRTWGQPTSIIGTAGVKYGYSAALDGDTLVVGAPDGPGTAPGLVAGTVHVYKYNVPSGVWQQQGVIRNPDSPPDSADEFGSSCDVQGNLVVVGDPRDSNGNGTNAGAVYLFDITGLSPTSSAILLGKFIGPPLTANANLGTSVAIDGDWAVGGAPYFPTAPGPAGFALPIHFNGTTWVAQPFLPSPSMNPNSRFGWDVDVEGTRLVVAAPLDDPTPTVDGGLVYEYQSVPPGSPWSVLNPPISAAALPFYTPQSADSFGWAVSLDSNKLAVSALGSTRYSPGSGLLMVLAWNGLTWTGTECIPSDPLDPPTATGVGFGWNVALDQEVVVASAIQRPDAPGAGTHPPVGGSFVFRGGLWQDYCYGDGASVNGGRDCPCINAGAPNNSIPALHQGCTNSTEIGGRLTMTGSTSILANDQVAHAFNLPVGVSALVFVGTQPANGGLGTPVADGLSCVAGSLKRLPVQVVDGYGAANWGPNLAMQAAWMPGATTYLQVFYRNPMGSPCGAATLGFNESNGVQAAMAP